MALITLDSVIKSALVAEGKSHVDELYARFLLFAQNAVRQIAYSIAPQIKTKVLEVENSIANFPSDMIDYSRLFVIIEDVVYLLGRNDDIPQLDSLFIDRPEVDLDRNNRKFAFYNHYTFTRGVYALNTVSYGIGGAWERAGSYRPNYDLQRFDFSYPLASDKVYLEYFATPLKCGEETMVDERAQEVIEEYIKYQYYKMIKSSRIISATQLRQQYRDMVNAKRRYRKMVNAPLLKEVVHEIRKKTYQAPK